MPGARIEALLASFPKLIQSNSQHTFVETDSVRYVYQPLEDLYMIVITTKNSNILQDIDTLHLLARAVSNQSHSLDEHDILLSCFEILEAFDEIVSLGYRENVSLAQVQTMLEMDSHEERIHEIIERNKELEAKEELKRRARQLEMQRRDASRRQGTTSGFGSSDGYQSIPKNYDTPAPSAPVHAMPDPSTGAPHVPFKGKGMQLGKKPKSAALLGQAKPVKLSSDAATPAQVQPRSPAIPSEHAPAPVSKPVSKPVSHAQTKRFAPNLEEKSSTSSLLQPQNSDTTASWDDSATAPTALNNPVAEALATEVPLQDARSEFHLEQHQDPIKDPYADLLEYQQDTDEIQPRSPTQPGVDPHEFDPYAADSVSNPAMTNLDDAQQTDYDIQSTDNAESQLWDLAQEAQNLSVNDPYASTQNALDSPAVPLSSIVSEQDLHENEMNHDSFLDEAQEPNRTAMNHVNELESNTNQLFDSEPVNEHAESHPFASLDQFGAASTSIDALSSQQQDPFASVQEAPIAESTHADLVQADDQYHTESMPQNEPELLSQSGWDLRSESKPEPFANFTPTEFDSRETPQVPAVTEVPPVTEMPTVNEMSPVTEVPPTLETSSVNQVPPVQVPSAVSEASIAPDAASVPVPVSEPTAASVQEPMLKDTLASTQQHNFESPTSSGPSVEFLAKERVSLTSNREGGLDSMEIKGDLMLRIHDASYARLAIHVDAADQFGRAEIQYRTHPHVDKQAWASEHRITLRDPRRPFPLNQQVGILRWRAITQDEAQRPLGISVWLSPMQDGACEVNIEYELERQDLTLSDVSIVIPIPANVQPDLAEPESGSVEFDSESSRVIWQLPTISSSNPTASLECIVPSGAENVDCLFPVSASFSTNHTLSDVRVKEVSTTDSQSPVLFQSQAQLTTDNYLVH